ncbi:MAG TPA: UvrD-helicase domain-containing protein, partial [Beijerinckiaceae bacterium]|nr:UvrD-helicase domain-containing protein [Beijerinckiaceae bacterium]
MSARDFSIPKDTLHRQRRAADPRASAWVSANAGAGKTKVLTDRVVRLLLAGSPPGRILCLTFTKAAAATMAIRVFELLGSWVTLPEADLVAELTELEGEPPSREKVRLARRLFARAVETPGGLKIETIHAFCERILHLVPFEANVPARFAVLDDSKAAELLAEARTRVLAEAATRELRFEHLARALDVVSPYAAGDDFFRVLECAVRDERVPDDRESLDAAMRRLAAALGLQPGETEAGLKLAMIEDGLPSAEWVRLAAVLGRSRNKSDHSIAETFARAAAATDVDQRLAYYRAIFFTDKGIPRQRIVTQAVDEFDSERLQDEQRRLESLDGKLRAACAVERTKALFTLAGAVRRRVAEAKARLGALDFDDLIRKTLLLLQRDTAAWVL